MKKLFVLILASLILNVTTSFAKEEKPASDSTKDVQMAEWQKSATPSESHKRLDVLVGKWNHTAKWRMSAEGQIEVMQGTNENHWILGDRFIYQDVKGSTLEKPFEGIGIMGYDNIRVNTLLFGLTTWEPALWQPLDSLIMRQMPSMKLDLSRVL